MPCCAIAIVMAGIRWAGTRTMNMYLGPAQGFIPAIIAREVLIRNNVVNGQVWLAFLVVSICLAISAFYELIEWWVALLSGESADAFLGTQGYVWDTQSDMGLALLGAILALWLLSALHNRQLRKL